MSGDRLRFLVFVLLFFLVQENLTSHLLKRIPETLRSLCLYAGALTLVKDAVGVIPPPASSVTAAADPMSSVAESVPVTTLSTAQEDGPSAMDVTSGASAASTSSATSNSTAPAAVAPPLVAPSPRPPSPYIDPLDLVLQPFVSSSERDARMLTDGRVTNSLLRSLDELFRHHRDLLRPGLRKILTLLKSLADRRSVLSLLEADYKFQLGSDGDKADSFVYGLCFNRMMLLLDLLSKNFADDLLAEGAVETVIEVEAFRFTPGFRLLEHIAFLRHSQSIGSLPVVEAPRSLTVQSAPPSVSSSTAPESPSSAAAADEAAVAALNQASRVHSFSNASRKLSHSVCRVLVLLGRRNQGAVRVLSEVLRACLEAAAKLSLAIRTSRVVGAAHPSSASAEHHISQREYLSFWHNRAQPWQLLTELCEAHHLSALVLLVWSLVLNAPSDFITAATKPSCLTAAQRSALALTEDSSSQAASMFGDLVQCFSICIPYMNLSKTVAWCGFHLSLCRLGLEPKLRSDLIDLRSSLQRLDPIPSERLPDEVPSHVLRNILDQRLRHEDLVHRAIGLDPAFVSSAPSLEASADSKWSLSDRAAQCICTHQSRISHGFSSLDDVFAALSDEKSHSDLHEYSMGLRQPPLRLPETLVKTISLPEHHIYWGVLVPAINTVHLLLQAVVRAVTGNGPRPTSSRSGSAAVLCRNVADYFSVTLLFRPATDMASLGRSVLRTVLNSRLGVPVESEASSVDAIRVAWCVVLHQTSVFFRPFLCCVADAPKPVRGAASQHTPTPCLLYTSDAADE